MDGENYGGDIEEIAKQKRFVPDRGFAGAEGSAQRGSGPVQFEKDQEDSFGIDKLLADVKRVRTYTKFFLNQNNTGGVVVRNHKRVAVRNYTKFLAKKMRSKIRSKN